MFKLIHKITHDLWSVMPESSNIVKLEFDILDCDSNKLKIFSNTQFILYYFLCAGIPILL